LRIVRNPKHIRNTKVFFLITNLFVGFLYACSATETHKTMETLSVESNYSPYNGTRYPLAVGKFANRSNYMNGIFSDGYDRLGSQAKMILKTHLVQTKRFIVMERENLEEMAVESKLTGTAQALEGAKQIITGEITEFGRKETGDRALFGIFGQGKQQTAYSKISLNIVDVRTSRTIYSVQGAGEYTLNNREILGFGSTAEYDSTLNGKVINLAIIDVVNKLVSDFDKGKWKPILK
jgi:curli biogenesis system outer membrane secretion channel CsgG